MTLTHEINVSEASLSACLPIYRKSHWEKKEKENSKKIAIKKQREESEKITEWNHTYLIFKYKIKSRYRKKTVNLKKKMKKKGMWKDKKISGEKNLWKKTKNQDPRRTTQRELQKGEVAKFGGEAYLVRTYSSWIDCLVCGLVCGRQE